jgi:hypothetical protein
MRNYVYWPYGEPRKFIELAKRHYKELAREIAK